MFLYHFAVIFIPSSNLTLGRYPNNFDAFEISAQVRGTSPGCIGNTLIFTFLPAQVLAICMNRFNDIGRPFPKLYTWHPSGLSHARITPSTISPTYV